MISSRFLLLICAIIFFHTAKADAESDITQKIEKVMNGVSTLLHNPAIQQAAQAHESTQRMMKEAAELANKILTILLTASNKIFATGKCVRQVKSTFIDQVEQKATTLLKCELDLVKATDGKTKKWSKDFTKLAKETLASIEKAADEFLNCPKNAIILGCAEKAIRELWSALKKLINTLPNDIIKPGWDLSNEISKGIYKCKIAKIKTLISIKKQLFGGLKTCWKAHAQGLEDLIKVDSAAKPALSAS